MRYAHRWAYRRNPNYYDYEEIGGDCTNFASQCLFAGTGLMNFTPNFGWYYLSANQKAPAWTGVSYFYNFMTRAEQTRGPFAVETNLNGLELGDFVQLRFRPTDFGHTPIIVAMGEPPTLENTLIAAHSYDADWRPLSSYFFQEIRYLHVLGAYLPPVLPINAPPTEAEPPKDTAAELPDPEAWLMQREQPTPEPPAPTDLTVVTPTEHQIS